MGARGPKLTYANVMSTIAVGLALAGGTAWAVDRISSGDIKRNAVRSKHIKKDNVKGKDVKESSLKLEFDGHVSIPISSFVNCTDQADGRLDFQNGASDADPDLFTSAAEGQGYSIHFDADVGFEDEGTRSCSQLQIPPDYAGGGSLLLNYTNGDLGSPDSLLCGAAINNIVVTLPVTVALPDTGSSTGTVECRPTINNFGEPLAGGDTFSFFLAVDPLDNQIFVRSVAFRYDAEL